MDNKVNQMIFDVVENNKRKLLGMFPELIKDGKLDLSVIKEALGEYEEIGTEKYEFTWAGKKNAKKTSQDDAVNMTLKIADENKTIGRNLYIEGDNLQVMKLLRNNYYSSIKMIYIDPPYNTGSDFIYNDNFRMEKETSDEFEELAFQGEKYTVNSKSQNRFHANWLNMIYSRLIVARDLLKDEGVIFISIDEYEFANLLKVCNEVFGEDCAVGVMPRKTKSATNDPNSNFNNQHDYILVYSKFPNVKLKGIEKKLDNYKNPDDDPRGEWVSGDPSAKSGGDGTYFGIENPLTGNVDMPPQGRYWAFNRETCKRYIEEGRIKFKEKYTDKERGFIFKRYKNELKSNFQPVDSLVLNDSSYMNQVATKGLNDISIDFDYSKPVALIKYLLEITNLEDGDIVMDFFSGSATTAHAVMEYNDEHQKELEYIMIQLQEKVEDDRTICDIAKQRIDIVNDKFNNIYPYKNFKLGVSNIRWNEYKYDFPLEEYVTYSPDKLDFYEGSKDVDIVYELLLRQNNIKINSDIITLYSIGDRTYLIENIILICLETKIDSELVEKIANVSPMPMRIIFRDTAFADDIVLKDECLRRLNVLYEKNSGEKKVFNIQFL